MTLQPQPSPVLDDIAEQAKAVKLARSANSRIIFGTAALFMIAVPITPTTGDSYFAHLVTLLLVARLAHLGLTPRLRPQTFLERYQPFVVMVGLLLLILMQQVIPNLFAVERAWPFLLLSGFGLAVATRRSTNGFYVGMAAMLSMVTFIQGASPWWGVAFGAATAGLANLSLHSRLRADEPLRPGDHPGGPFAAVLMGIVLIIAAFWFPNIGPDWDESSNGRDFENSSGDIPLNPDGSSGGSPSGNGGGTSGDGDGGAYETRPDGSIVFVPLEPGDKIPAGTVVVQQTGGGFGTPNGNGFVTCDDGELVYGELQPGEDPPPGATPMIRQLVTDRKGDGRVLECGPSGATIRPLEPGEEVPASAVEILKDDGRFDHIPRVERDDAEQESSPFNISLTAFLIGIGVLIALLVGWLIWRRKQIPWLTLALRRFDNAGASYGRHLRSGESLQAFAADFPATTQPLAQQIADQLEHFAFAPEGHAAQQPSPALIEKVNQLLRALKEQTRADRRARFKAKLGRRRTAVA